MADNLVLEAQRWVNSTYGSVAGYARCPETGNTGWSTMYSLTRALQHELGITTLSDSFGPTTIARLESRGPIGIGESNAKIIKIIQAASFCKGYHAGDIDGVWIAPGPGGTSYYSTGGAIGRMTADMGIGTQTKLAPQVFKALLTMDAYVLVSGGSEEVRKIQQWLNKNYWSRTWGAIIPTEGHYSRDVQKMLMKALQSEFGIADSSVTGNFGPATQTGLESHTLARGATGIFVQLLSAACVFNGPVPNKAGSTTSTLFKTSFDGALATYLSNFQWFSLLEQNGTADYVTWCQLLVSMGDPDRHAGACDTRFTITQALATSLSTNAKNAYKVVGRYLDETASSTLNKELQPGELDAIFNGGMKVFPIWQYNARLLGDFTWSEGYDHGVRVHDRMVHYGFNSGAIVYFAVDYDATDPEITSNIIPYFRGAQAALLSRGRRYLAGVYGSRNVCRRVSDETLVVSSFVSGMSWGFSGNLGFPLPHNWAFNQIKEIKYTGGGQTIDLDRVVHRTSVDPGIGRDGVNGKDRSSVTQLLDYVDDVYAAAKTFGDGATDAIATVRTLEYLRSPKYTGVYSGWGILLGSWDQKWLDHANSLFETRHRQNAEFDDPSHATPIHLDHLAATANAVLLKDAGGKTTANRGDFGGWGGDLTTFYCDWMNNESSYASGYAFCVDRLAKKDVVSSYSFSDMVEDADGHLIGKACRSGTPVHTALRNHLQGAGHTTRFRDFYQSKFGSSKDSAIAAARYMLESDLGGDDSLRTLRGAIYRKDLNPLKPSPTDLPGIPDYKFDPFLEGFGETLRNLASIG